MQKRLEEIEKNHKSQLEKLESKATESIVNANKIAYNELNLIQEKFQKQMKELNDETLNLQDDKNKFKFLYESTEKSNGE